MGRGMKRLFIFLTILYWVAMGAWALDGTSVGFDSEDVSGDRIGFALGLYAFAFGVGWTICGFMPRNRD
ncbi:hypothetical protein [Caulobacter sp. 17J80-11]|uniref:hypothetical protein n=1 Tax=Caulobacter sp. 17J80-11 TaxID=2763502 RepID=UPI001653A3AF|nr:hypothetical protein [Caulobacter sp. 17J80-11]MBC6982341.1 hypothetical protein [Caulobacter sp. 17J80-11]